MAIYQGTETIAVTSQERTWRVSIETPKGGNPVVTVYRELVKTAADGSVISKETIAPAQRSLSAVATENQPFIPAVSGQISGAELAGLIAARGDMWRQEDIAGSI
jgi:hypothetical protein